jgi:PAS domain S-box-containing protein
MELGKSRAQLETELANTRLLQSLSSELLCKDNINSLYQRILVTAMHIMRSDFASLQMVYTESGKSSKLKLLAYHGLNDEAAALWEWVDAVSGSSPCSEALRKSCRIIVPNVEKCDFMKGTDDLAFLLQTGIHAIQSTPLYSRSGKLLGMISTHWGKTHMPLDRELNFLDLLARQAADLIEYKLGQEMLRESEEKYRTLFDHMNEGFFLAETICDETGKAADYRYLAANPALDKIIGINHKDIIGKTRNEVLKFPSPCLETFAHVAFTGEPTALENFSFTQNRYFQMRIFSPKRGLFACLTKDITEHKKLEEEILNQQKKLLKIEKEKNGALKKAIETKDEFLTTISHEFKTPLTVINAALQTIDSIYGDQLPENVNKHLQRIRTNSFRQLRLVNNLLDVTRYNAGGFKLNRKNIDIVFLTGAIVRSVDLYARQKGINIKYSTDIEKKEIAIDDEKYERVLLNLLSNAIKFTPRDKSVYINISYKNRKVIVTFKDEGIGIPKNKQKLIFERFGQVDNSLTRQAEGTGIGLSLVKALVEGMDGTITVESDVDKGSLFTLSIPAVKLRSVMPAESHANLQDSRIMKSTAIEFSDIYWE